MIENYRYFYMTGKKKRVSLSIFFNISFCVNLWDFKKKFPPIWEVVEIIWQSWQSVLHCKIITKVFLMLYLSNIPLLFCLFSLFLSLLFTVFFRDHLLAQYHEAAAGFCTSYQSLWAILAHSLKSLKFSDTCFYCQVNSYCWLH